MKRFLFALAMLMPVSTVFAAEPPGLLLRKVNAPHHGRNMDMAVWYPGEGGTQTTFAENPIFVGDLVRQDAKPLPGKHPVIVLSHGMGGGYLSMNWLATRLAARGAVVVAVNHPNGWFKDRDPKKMFDHWTRVQDLQVALDSVLADKALAAVVDPSRIYMAGFSFGGWTALSIAGVTADPEGSVAYCSAAGERSHNCMDLKTFGIDPAKGDTASWTASYKDARIKAVVAIDPGLTWKLGTEDVRDVEQDKLLIIGLGTGPDRHYATDTTPLGSNFEALVPDAKVEVLAPATHFTAMPVCKAEGEAFLAAEKDDPVCTDPAGGNRKAMHDKMVALIAQHFGLN
ncbi:MAG: alpha/beta hydrolase family protein [Aestuariivirga sp.]